MTREYLSTIIKNLTRSTLIFLASLLTAIRGLALSYALKLGSAELSVPTATDSIPSSNKTTMTSEPSRKPSESSPPVTNLVYNTPDAFLHDFQRGKIPASAVNMEQWLLAHAWIMVDSGQPTLTKEILVEGNMYEMTFRMKSIMYAERAHNIVRRQH